MSGRDRQSNPLTNYLDSASETGTRPSWRPYLYGLLGVGAVIVLGALVVWLA